MSTLFKKIIDREIPADIIYEDKLCLAFNDINPQAPVHILLIPKKEIRSLEQLDKEDQSLMGHLLLKISEIAKEKKLEGYRVVANTNASGGQTVYHLHFHILSGRNMTWPPG